MQKHIIFLDLNFTILRKRKLLWFFLIWVYIKVRLHFRALNTKFMDSRKATCTVGGPEFEPWEEKLCVLPLCSCPVPLKQYSRPLCPQCILPADYCATLLSIQRTWLEIFLWCLLPRRCSARGHIFLNLLKQQLNHQSREPKYEPSCRLRERKLCLHSSEQMCLTAHNCWFRNSVWCCNSSSNIAIFFLVLRRTYIGVKQHPTTTSQPLI